MAKDILTEIFQFVGGEVARLKAEQPLSLLRAEYEKLMATNRPRTNKMLTALQAAKTNQQLPLIAEVKKASPSKGVIRADFDPIALVHDYSMAGATGLSILTETKWFQGSIEFLKQARGMTELPILRKDFILDEYQLYQSKLAGADVVLLILAGLPAVKAQTLEKQAIALGLEVLLETHDREEIKLANDMASPLVGVNNRNLKNLSVSLQNGLELLHEIDQTKLAIAESGIKSPNDAYDLWQAGARAFLMGEHFMRQTDVFSACQDFKNTSEALIFV